MLVARPTSNPTSTSSRIGLVSMPALSTIVVSVPVSGPHEGEWEGNWVCGVRRGRVRVWNAGLGLLLGDGWLL